MFKNPALGREFSFAQAKDAPPMTLKGTLKKTSVLLVVLVLAAYNSYCWAALGTASLSTLIAAGALGGFAVAMVTIFNPSMAWVTAPLYAILEGIAIGSVTFAAESATPGVAIPTVGLTVAILIVMLVMWRKTSFRVTLSFRKALLISMLGIVGVYLTTILLTVCGVDVMWLHAHPVLNTFAALIASLCLTVDFCEIETRIDDGAPSYMEWYSAFGLMLTLVWLYLELLRLMGSSD